MTSLTGEELEQFLDDAVKTVEDDTAWLRERGWTDTGETHKERGFEAKLWVSPSGKKAVHCSSMIGFDEYSQDVDVAHGELLTELSWGSIILCQHYEHKDPEEWGYFAHPESGKVYSFLEAVEIARHYDNSEQAYFNAGNGLCGKTEQLQEELGDMRLPDGERLNIQFIRSGEGHRWVLL